MKIDIISKKEFAKLDYELLFENAQTSRAFGKISGVPVNYKFAWQSDTLVPKLLDCGSGNFFISIDQEALFFNVIKNKGVLKLDLKSFFYDAILNNSIVYVVSELEIFVVKIESFKIEQIYDLPDIFSSLSIKPDGIEVTCLSGDVLYFRT